jgi:PKHD-type hydroxylase
MNQHWQYWPQILNENIINSIINLGEQYPKVKPTLGFDGKTNNNQYRSSDIHWINPNDNHSKFLVDILWYFAKEANRNAFNFDIDYIPDIQYTKYYSEDNGKYDWHSDTFWANPTLYDRKLSIIIQLSDSNDYTGGDFEIDPHYHQLPKDIIRQKGTVIVFPSFLNHRVTTLLTGSRKSLVSWVQGPKFR